MEKLTSILVVIDPLDETRHVIAKAMILARHFGAQLELFFCDSEQVFILRHACDSSGVEKALRECTARGERYLDALRRSLADDVSISTHVASASPHHEAVVRRVLETRPDLVIKAAAGRHPLQRLTLDANDWQLARTCPAPLLLTRSRPWAACPLFAAATDVSEHEGTELARSITNTAEFLARGCRGRVDAVFSDRSDGSSVYDVVVLGAVTRRRVLRLVNSLECDFVLMKPESHIACSVVPPLRAAKV